MALITTAEAWNEKRILHGVRAVKVSVDSTMTDIEVAAVTNTNGLLPCHGRSTSRI